MCRVASSCSKACASSPWWHSYDHCGFLEGMDDKQGMSEQSRVLQGGLTPVCCEAGGACAFPDEQAVGADGVQGVHQANVVAPQALRHATPRPAPDTLCHTMSATCTDSPWGPSHSGTASPRGILLPGLCACCTRALHSRHSALLSACGSIECRALLQRCHACPVDHPQILAQGSLSRRAIPCEAIAIWLVDHIQQQPAPRLRHSGQHIRQQIHPIADEQLRNEQCVIASGAWQHKYSSCYFLSFLIPFRCTGACDGWWSTAQLAAPQLPALAGHRLTCETASISEEECTGM